MVNWGPDEMNAIQAFGAARLMGMTDLSKLAKDTNDLLSVVRDAITNKGISDDLSAGVKAFLVQRAVGSQNLLSRSSGAILNPNVELLFRSPQLRPFNFSFFLTARDKPDADEVKKSLGSLSKECQ